MRRSGVHGNDHHTHTHTECIRIIVFAQLPGLRQAIFSLLCSIFGDVHMPAQWGPDSDSLVMSCQRRGEGERGGVTIFFF